MAKKDKYQWYNHLNSKSTKELKKALILAKKCPVPCNETILKITIVLKDRKIKGLREEIMWINNDGGN